MQNQQRHHWKSRGCLLRDSQCCGKISFCSFFPYIKLRETFSVCRSVAAIFTSRATKSPAAASEPEMGL